MKVHEVTAGRAAHAARRRRCGGRRVRRRLQVNCIRLCRRGGEVGAQRFELLTMGGTEEAIVTHLDKALGQDMLKKAMDEFFGGQGAELGLTGVGFVTEGDLVILHLDDAAVADRDAKDVGGEIFEGGATVADGLTVDDPILLPY